LVYRANRAQSYVEEVKALELFEEVAVETVPDFPRLYATLPTRTRPD